MSWFKFVNRSSSPLRWRHGADTKDPESLFKALHTRGWFWEGDFIYAPNKMLWLDGRILWNGSLCDFHQTFSVRVQSIIKMKGYHDDPKQHQQVVEDNESLVSALEEVLMGNRNNSYLIHLSESDQTDFGRVDFRNQPEPQQVFSAVWEVESRVNNGGFDQYFRNSDVDIIAFAPAALKAIGAKECARIVQAAIKVLPPLPATQENRHAALDALSEKQQEELESLDSEFFEYPDDLTELLFCYVAQHPDAFANSEVRQLKERAHDKDKSEDR